MANYDERLVLDSGLRDNIIYNEHLVRYELAKEFVDSKTVLEIASGSGYGSSILAKSGAKKVIAMDVSQEAIDMAQEKYGHEKINFKLGDAENIDFEDNFFDVIVSFETVEHLKNPSKFISELKRVLSDDGLVLISTPNKDVFKEKNPYHLKEFTKDEFSDLLSQEFKYFKILEQTSALASFISDINIDSSIDIINKNRADYFIAICSKTEVDLKIKKSFVSLNPLALERIKNNPVMKFSDNIYRILQFLRIK